MRKLGKSLLLIVMLLCMFSYMGVANAIGKDAKFLTAEASAQSAIESLLSGQPLSETDKSVLIPLTEKYELYTKPQELTADEYAKFKQGQSADMEQKLYGIINPIDETKFSQLSQSGWSAITNPPQVQYSDLSYDAANPTGYLVVLVAKNKTDSKLYYYGAVYQATSATTLATYASVANGATNTDEVNKDVDKEETPAEEADVDKDEAVEKEEKAESNPKTGISDMAIYLVPLSLVAGSALMLKRRHA